MTVTRHDEPVACVMGYQRMSAVAETLEIMGNAAAMEALREHQAGKTKFGRLADIPETAYAVDCHRRSWPRVSPRLRAARRTRCCPMDAGDLATWLCQSTA